MNQSSVQERDDLVGRYMAAQEACGLIACQPAHTVYEVEYEGIVYIAAQNHNGALPMFLLDRWELEDDVEILEAIYDVIAE